MASANDFDIQVVEPTQSELREEVVRLARDNFGPDATAEEAFERLDRGEFRGSILESQLSMLRFLLGEDAPRLAAE